MVAKKAGQFAGGFFNNAGVLAAIGIVSAIAIPLVIFRKDITNALAGAVSEAAFESAGEAIGGAVSGAGEAVGEFFGGIGESVGEAVGGVGDVFGGIGESVGQAVDSIGDIIEGGLPEIGDVDFTESGAAAARGARGGTGEEPSLIESVLPEIGETFRTEEDEGIVTVSAIDEFGIGGGPSFEGGTTTFGDAEVDTLTEVLALFPDLTASQARDLLEENPDLTQSEFRLLNPDVINISSFDEEPQDFLQASDPSLSGLTAEQIAFILTGGDISNF